YQDYESEITRLQLQIAALSSRQRRLKVYEARLQNLAAPIQKLPNEILMLIFDLVSQDNRHARISTLGHSICSRWRELSLSFSVLWSRISL
ncbi:hypothetical protein BT96DRAFT_795163, partial [Gymnopus androsaceus JB14]